MVWTTYWAPQPWNSTQGRWTPRVIWRPVGLAVGLCETWTLLVNSAHNLACSQNKAEAADWDGTGLWSVLHDYPSLCTGLSQHPVLHLWLFRTVPWKGEGCHCWEECSTAGDWAGSDLTQHLNRVWQPWLALLEDAGWKWSEIVTGMPELPPSTCLTNSRYTLQPYLIHHCSLLGWSYWCWEEVKHRFKKTGSAWTWNTGLLPQDLSTHP